MNREIVLAGGGAGIYPLLGDILSTAGNQAVRVTGLQGIPIESGLPSAGAVLVYNQNVNQWQPIANATMLVNLIPISDDYIITVNFVSIQQFLISVNGANAQIIYEPSYGHVNANGTPVN
jgi:hypothetical protein